MQDGRLLSGRTQEIALPQARALRPLTYQLLCTADIPEGIELSGRRSGGSACVRAPVMPVSDVDGEAGKGGAGQLQRWWYFSSVTCSPRLAWGRRWLVGTAWVVGWWVMKWPGYGAVPLPSGRAGDAVGVDFPGLAAAWLVEAVAFGG
jgi:hypothetical protein